MGSGEVKYTLIVAALLLAGCASTKTEPIIKIETREVKVPIVQPYPPVAVVPHPDLEITKIDNTTPPGVVAQSYVVTIQQLLNHIQQLETQIKGINDARQASPTTP